MTAADEAWMPAIHELRCRCGGRRRADRGRLQLHAASGARVQAAVAPRLAARLPLIAELGLLALGRGS